MTGDVHCRAFDVHSLPYVQRRMRPAAHAAAATSVMWWDHVDARWGYPVVGMDAASYLEEDTAKVQES